jgi:hypothetical protein
MNRKPNLLKIKEKHADKLIFSKKDNFKTRRKDFGKNFKQKER